MNSVRCLNCNTVLVSKSVHDFQRCPCPEGSYIFIDGGDSYQRMGFCQGSRWMKVEADGTETGPFPETPG